MSLIKEVIPSVQIPCGICGDYRIERKEVKTTSLDRTISMMKDYFNELKKDK